MMIHDDLFYMIHGPDNRNHPLSLTYPENRMVWYDAWKFLEYPNKLRFPNSLRQNLAEFATGDY